MNGPVTLLIAGGLVAVMVVGELSDLPGWLALCVIFAPLLVGWLWWSVALPRWRVWALEHVDQDEWGELLQQAISHRLMWPSGHILEKTEIKSRRLREREREVGW